MDPVIILSVVMLIVWGVGTWFEAPGWIHLLLTAGVFLLIWRIATRPAAASPGTGRNKR
ncbi:hypothetical protein LBMAG44_02640 [Gemmatimonadota bacterium]|jgi:hypothetical protein|nr:hypothetical protein LBMAG44_02640 [Gemmatimonadota bacterium]